MDSKEFFNAIKNNQNKFSEVKNKQDNFLKKLNEVKIGKKTYEQKRWSIISINFTIPEKKLLSF